MNETEHIVAQYAEDAAFLFDGSERSLYAILDTTDDFNKM